jgi:hypothetical protein
MLDGDIEKREVYQLQLPATSVFGDGKDGKLGLQAYGKFLAANNVHAISVVTRMKFDVASEQPKLSFSAVRPLDQEELETALEMRDSQESKDAVTLTVGAFDGAKKQQAQAAPAAQKKKAAPVVEEDDEEPAPAPKKKAAPVVEEDDDEEPAVRSSKKAATKETPAPALDDLIDEWDD